MERLREEVADLAADDPPAALKAVAVLERTTGEVARQAALTVAEDAEALPWPAVATALGLTEQDARARVDRYGLHPAGGLHL